MKINHEPLGGFVEPRCHQIRLRGHLDDRRAAWFEGMTLWRETTGDTLLTGMVADQAALFGLLMKIRDLGVPLISVNLLSAGPSDEEGGAE